MRLLLASTSPARRALLDALGVPYAVEAPGVDEDVPAGHAGGVGGADARPAEGARGGSATPGALVLGADQLAEVDGRALGKPESREAARAQLGALLGRSHRLLTAVALVGGGDEQLELDVVTLRFHPVARGRARALPRHRRVAGLRRRLPHRGPRTGAGGRAGGRPHLGPGAADAPGRPDAARARLPAAVSQGGRVRGPGRRPPACIRRAHGGRGTVVGFRRSPGPGRPGAPRRWRAPPRGPGAAPRA